MKKLVFGILIFAVVAVSVTGVLISLKLNKNENINNASGDKGGETIVSNTEKTLDLYGTYDENDIEIEEILEVVESINKEVKIPVISGLKDKNVENKINADMKKRITEKLIEFFDKNGDIGSQYIYVGANFSNVISISWSINYHKENYEYKTENVTLNYELINGERLNFEDLFVKDVDLYSIVRRAFYRAVSRDVEVAYSEIACSDVYYDKESNEWKFEYTEYNENTGDYVAEREYIPSLTEYDINKKINIFMNEEEKSFCFTPARVYIGEAYSKYNIEFKDIADEVVIYDKYLTKESLYEISNIGLKNLWTCAGANTQNIKYQNYGFAEDNLFYEITMNAFQVNRSVNYPFKDSINKLQEKVIELSKDKIESYRKIARENPDKFYVLLIRPSAGYDDSKEISFLISTDISESMASVDISYKKEIVDKIIECYRYYNIGFYENSGLYLAFHGEGPCATINSLSDFEEKSEKKAYDARTLKELTSLEEIFKKDSDYMFIVNQLLHSAIRRRQNDINAEDLKRLVENSEYFFDAYAIYAKVPGYDNEILVEFFGNMDKSLLKIYDLDMYIISESSIRKIEKSEIQNLSLDELNKAYNEIFARHGHDFKNAELKAYFNGLSWYKPIPNKTVSLNELSEIERYNLDIIKNVISEKK